MRFIFAIVVLIVVGYLLATLDEDKCSGCHQKMGVTDNDRQWGSINCPHCGTKNWL